jgi:sirohydrochlorin ferrochelatase
MPEPESFGGEVLVTVAHGSKDPRAAATIETLTSLVRSRAAARGLDVRTAYLGHAAPSLPQVLGTVRPGQRVTVLPLLLTAAFHSKADIPRLLARMRLPGSTVTYGATLGPHPLLIDALERRLAQCGAAGGEAGGEAGAALDDRAGTAVVLAAAGSSDPEANATIARLAARWQARGGWHSVVPAYASAASPRPGAAVADALRRGVRGPGVRGRAVRSRGARRVVVATYLLAPGLFADRIRTEALAAGAVAVAPVLGAAPEIADIVLDRYATAGTDRQNAA